MPTKGRPPMFETPEQLQTEVDKYLTDPNIPVKTITGLAYHLGFESRQSFYDYEQKPNFTYTIKRCRLYIESLYEARLFENANAGAIFGLKNFGWTDKQEIEHTVNDPQTVKLGGQEISF